MPLIDVVTEWYNHKNGSYIYKTSLSSGFAFWLLAWQKTLENKLRAFGLVFFKKIKVKFGEKLGRVILPSI